MDNTIDNAASTISNAQGEAMETAERGFEQFSAKLSEGQAKVKTTVEKAMRKAEDVASFNQGTLEAMVRSGQIWMAGMQDLGKQFAATAQGQLDHTVSAFKTISSLRSLRDVVDVQTSFARASVEKAMADTGTLTDATFKLAEQTMAPLTARVHLAVETFAKAA